MDLPALHTTAAAITGAAALALLAVGSWVQLRGGAPAIRVVLVLRRVGLIAVGFGAVLGLALLASGRRPHDGLHFLYAFIALGAIPVASALAVREPHRGGLYHALAGLLLLGVCIRLVATG